MTAILFNTPGLHRFWLERVGGRWRLFTILIDYGKKEPLASNLPTVATPPPHPTPLTAGRYDPEK